MGGNHETRRVAVCYLDCMVRLDSRRDIIVSLGITIRAEVFFSLGQWEILAWGKAFSLP
jgi:hypothetical protein